MCVCVCVCESESKRVSEERSSGYQGQEGSKTGNSPKDGMEERSSWVQEGKDLGLGGRR